MDIVQGNKLIAAFDGRYKGSNPEELSPYWEDEVLVEEKYDPWGNDKSTYRSFTYADLNYHTSWDWLMPVVEKIWKMEFLTSLNFYTANGFNFSCEMKIYRNGIGESEIEAETPNPVSTVWQTVVQFIIWYNETKLITQA